MGFIEFVGGASYLTELTNYVPTASHVNQYADIVAQKALRRRLNKSFTRHSRTWVLMKLLAYKGLIENAEIKIFEVSQKHVKQDVTSLENILTESFDRLR